MKGVSKDKFCKGTDIPKHSGNFSYHTVHYQSLQSKDYHVTLRDGVLIVGESTPLQCLMPEVTQIALNDPHFESYTRKGTMPHAGKRYEARQTLTKRERHYTYCDWMNYDFIYREMIYTDGEFDYQFKNY